MPSKQQKTQCYPVHLPKVNLEPKKSNQDKLFSNRPSTHLISQMLDVQSLISAWGWVDNCL